MYIKIEIACTKVIIDHQILFQIKDLFGIANICYLPFVYDTQFLKYSQFKINFKK